MKYHWPTFSWPDWVGVSLATPLIGEPDAGVVSTAGAMVDVLREDNVTETAVVTPYLAPVNDGLRRYLEASGIKVVERLSAEIPVEPTFERYLETKRDKMGHFVG